MVTVAAELDDPPDELAGALLGGVDIELCDIEGIELLEEVVGFGLELVDAGGDEDVGGAGFDEVVFAGGADDVGAGADEDELAADDDEPPLPDPEDPHAATPTIMATATGALHSCFMTDVRPIAWFSSIICRPRCCSG